MIERLDKQKLAKENLENAQQQQKTEYDKRDHEREFHVSDKVLVLLPSTAD